MFLRLLAWFLKIFQQLTACSSMYIVDTITFRRTIAALMLHVMTVHLSITFLITNTYIVHVHVCTYT